MSESEKERKQNVKITEKPITLYNNDNNNNGDKIPSTTGCTSSPEARFSPVGRRRPIRSSRTTPPSHFRPRCHRRRPHRPRRPNRTSGLRRQSLPADAVFSCAAYGVCGATGPPGCGRAIVRQRTVGATVNRVTAAGTAYTRPRSQTGPSASPGPAAGRGGRRRA